MSDEAAATALLSTHAHAHTRMHMHAHTHARLFWLASIPGACTNPLMSNYKG